MGSCLSQKHSSESLSVWLSLSIGRHDVGNALVTEVTNLCKHFYGVPMLRWHLQQKLLEQDHAASFGLYCLCYLPNGVAAK